MAKPKGGQGAQDRKRDPKTGQFEPEGGPAKEAAVPEDKIDDGSGIDPLGYGAPEENDGSGIRIIETPEDAKKLRRPIKPIPDKGRAKGSQGQQAGATPAPGQGDGQAAPAGSPAPAAGQQASGIRIKGLDGVEKVYKDAAAVEQMVRSLQGTYRTLAERAQTAESKVAERDRIAALWRDMAYERGYTDGPNDPYAARFAGTAQNAAAGGAAPGANPEGGDDLPDEVYKTYGDLLKSHGPGVAAGYLARETYKHARSTFQAELAKVNQPGQEFQQQMAMVQNMDGVLQQFRAAKDPAGNPLYPELEDPEAVSHIARIWKAAGYAPDAMYTPAAANRAVLEYRFWAQQSSQAAGDGGEQPADGASPGVEGTGGAGEGEGQTQPFDAQSAVDAAAAAIEGEGDGDGDVISDHGESGPGAGDRQLDPVLQELHDSYDVGQAGGEEDLGFSRD